MHGWGVWYGFWHVASGTGKDMVFYILEELLSDGFMICLLSMDVMPLSLWLGQPLLD